MLINFGAVKMCATGLASHNQFIQLYNYECTSPAASFVYL